MSEPKLYCVKRPDGSFVWETLWTNRNGAVNILFNRFGSELMGGRIGMTAERHDRANKLGYRIVRAVVVEVGEEA